MARKKASESEILAEKEAEFDSRSNYLSKQERINTEIERLNKEFRDIAKDKKGIVKSTIESVAFMTVQMEDLQENIVRDGTTVEYDNGGGQRGMKQSPDAQFYLQFSQKLTQAVKVLLDCLPKTQIPKSEDTDSNLLKFVQRKPR